MSRRRIARGFLLLALAVPAFAQDGEKLFASSCAVGYCHGAAGAAARGPRLRDRQFTREYLTRITRDGVPRSAMPAWKGKLADAEIDAVVTYILKLNGVTDSPPVAAAATTAPAAAAGPQPGEVAYREQCATCHAALPELKAPLALPAAPRHLKRIRLKDGDTFPAVIASEAAGTVVAWDFTEPPPVRRSLDRAEIVSTLPETAWKHPAVAPDLLAAIAKWAAAR